MQINIRSCPSVMKKIAAFAEFSFFACVIVDRDKVEVHKKHKETNIQPS